MRSIQQILRNRRPDRRPGPQGLPAAGQHPQGRHRARERPGRQGHAGPQGGRPAGIRQTLRQEGQLTKTRAASYNLHVYRKWTPVRCPFFITFTILDNSY